MRDTNVTQTSRFKRVDLNANTFTCRFICSRVSVQITFHEKIKTFLLLTFSFRPKMPFSNRKSPANISARFLEISFYRNDVGFSNRIGQDWAITVSLTVLALRKLTNETNVPLLNQEKPVQYMHTNIPLVFWIWQIFWIWWVPCKQYIPFSHWDMRDILTLFRL